MRAYLNACCGTVLGRGDAAWAEPASSGYGGHVQAEGVEALVAAVTQQHHLILGRRLAHLARHTVQVDGVRDKQGLHDILLVLQPQRGRSEGIPQPQGQGGGRRGAGQRIWQ